MKLGEIIVMVAVLFSGAIANCQAQDLDDLTELNNQIRREKFELVLPQAMRKNDIDMWLHVVRVAIPDPFAAEDLGSASGVFVFTDRGDDRIERAVLGRRWGAGQRAWGGADYKDPLPELGVYDIVGEPVLVVQPVSSPMTEYDYRFKGLKEFVEARDPERIAVNYRESLATWPTSVIADDGISAYRLHALDCRAR